MHGSKAIWRWGGMVLCLALALSGCVRATGATIASSVLVPTSGVSAFAIQLADMPLGTRLMIDLTPTDAELMAQISHPSSAPSLDGLGREAGSYRVFTYAEPEPSVLNVTTRATVEVDVFITPHQATQWMNARQQAIASSAGAAYPAAAPGQYHIVRFTTYRVDDIAATTTTLAFVDRNVYVEIMTRFVGPGISISDAERFANIIDGRLDHPAQ